MKHITHIQHTYNTHSATEKRQNFLGQTFRGFMFFLSQNTRRDIYVLLIFSHIKKLLITKEKSNSFFYILNTLKRVEKNYQAYIQISNNFDKKTYVMNMRVITGKCTNQFS